MVSCAVYRDYQRKFRLYERRHDDWVIAEDLCVVGEGLEHSVLYDGAIGREHWLMHF